MFKSAIDGNNKMSVKKIVKGFTLLEMAVVIAIMGIVMAGFVLPMLGQIKIRSQLLELQKYKETKHTLEEIKAALLGYVAITGMFPCPDTQNTDSTDPLKKYNPDGKQDSGCDANAVEGYIPWQTLGLVKGNDIWGNTIRYIVNKNYAKVISQTNSDAASPFFEIKDEKQTTKLSVSSNGAIIAIIFSCGKNAKPDLGNNRDAKTDCKNPVSNLTTSDFYIQDTRNYSTELENIPTDFDDVLTWISKYQIINALNNAGKWK